MSGKGGRSWSFRAMFDPAQDLVSDFVHFIHEVKELSRFCDARRRYEVVVREQIHAVRAEFSGPTDRGAQALLGLGQSAARLLHQVPLGLALQGGGMG